MGRKLDKYASHQKLSKINNLRISICTLRGEDRTGEVAAQICSMIEYSRKRRKKGSAMELHFGKHAGKSIELLLLKDPDYIVWMLAQKNAAGQMAAAQKEAKRLIAIFDKKLIGKKCYGLNCNRSATRCTVYNVNVVAPYWWCDTCNPYHGGAVEGKLQVIKTYADAISHVDLYCGGRKSDYQSLIRSMAEAKGLPSRVGNAQAVKFFFG